MGSATTRGFPYPVGTDRVMDGDNAIQALAEALDAGTGRPSASGNVNIPLTTANVPVTVVVTFPVGRFPGTPWVVATIVTSQPQIFSVSTGNPTLTNVPITACRTNAGGAITCSWMAATN